MSDYSQRMSLALLGEGMPQQQPAGLLGGMLQQNPAHPPEWWNRGVRNVAGGLLGGLADLVTFPGRFARGETGYTPGQMASEQPQATKWAGEMGLNMLGAPAAVGGVPGVGSGVGRGIKAYHGSPHDFDRFDLSKIGTGEGAQAYGYGLYFAENPKVAENYRNQLARTSIDFNGERFQPAGLSDHIWRNASGPIPDHVRGSPEFLNGIMDAVHEFASTGKRPSVPADLTSWMGYGPMSKKQGYAFAVDQLEKAKPSAGRMYEVNINAKPEQFLDWDKPLAQQSPEIAKGVRGVVMDAARKPAPMDGLRSYERAIIKGEDDRRALTGADAYAHLGRRFGDADAGVWTERNRAAASAALRDAGIPGIKYLDQGSRAAGAGSRNYVVFDDKLIDILRKYGLAGAPASGLAGALAGGATENQ